VWVNRRADSRQRETAGRGILFSMVSHGVYRRVSRNQGTAANKAANMQPARERSNARHRENSVRAEPDVVQRGVIREVRAERYG